MKWWNGSDVKLPAKEEFFMRRQDNGNREELLQQMRRQTERKPSQKNPEDTVSSDTGTFRIRLVLAGVLLLTVILLDQKDKCLAGISMDQVLHYVTDVDYGNTLKTWIETAVSGLQALL